ncbi:MAG: fluoride efflux transporter CrcB [Duncaniella sp.]|nr:fluoride efflux transporter CrcB [Duncaniella sp.]
MNEYVAVALGGALGCLSRYMVQQISLPGADRTLPTIAVNVIGCLLIGFIATLIDTHGGWRVVRLMLVTGFLGGFTTFSTFALDAVSLARAGEMARSLGYVAVSIIGGFAAFIIGQYSAEKLL